MTPVLPPWMEGVAFTVSEGRAIGLSDGRMRGSSFTRPHHGVRVHGDAGRVDGGLLDRCADLRVVLSTDTVFSHATAARLWEMPLPNHIDDRLHVLSPPGAVVRRPGVVGWMREAAVSATVRSGVPVTDPAQTWVMLSTMSADRGGRVSREWLVAVGDFLVSGRRRRYGRDQPLTTHAALEAAAREHGSRRGAASLAWALPRIRAVVDSPPETFLRLGLVARRLAEPAVQPAIVTAAGPRHPDLGYLEKRVLLEYLGDVHRVDPETWRQDLVRIQLFEDAGYRTVLIGAADLTPMGLDALTARIRRALR